MKFYTGLATVQDAWAFPRCMISLTRLQDRWTSFRVNNWLLDSGGFSQILWHGKFDMSPKAYARECDRWKLCGNLVGAMSQDYVCDPIVREKTGLSVEEHQRRTIENYVEVIKYAKVRIIPVIQGYKAKDYAQHVRDYGDLLKPNQWVAVGSLVSRSSDPVQILRILDAVKSERSDIHLHGFGLKTASLKNKEVRSKLFSSDSISWSRDFRFESWDLFKQSGQKKAHENGGQRAAECTRLQYDPRLALRYTLRVQELCEEEALHKFWQYDIEKIMDNVAFKTLV